jgi:hypothetical protein
MADVLPGEAVQQGQDRLQVERVRKAIADVYTFVRSQEYNRTIASYTFDHYIEFAKQAIKGTGRQIRDASGKAVGIRPAKLEALSNLKTAFQGALEQARKMAESVDNSSQNKS